MYSPQLIGGFQVVWLWNIAAVRAPRVKIG
jgi:hypothetical protein